MAVGSVGLVAMAINQWWITPVSASSGPGAPVVYVFLIMAIAGGAVMTAVVLCDNAS